MLTQRIILLVCILPLVAVPAFAQPDSTDRAPLIFGISLGPNTGAGSNFGGSVRIQHGEFIGTARLSRIELDRVVETSSIRSDRDFARELTLLAGLAIPIRGGWQATVSGGISGIRMYRYIAEPCNTVVFMVCMLSDGGRDVSDVIMGIPFEAGIDRPVLGRLGMGLRAYVNLNSAEHYSGFSLEFRLLPASRSASSK